MQKICKDFYCEKCDYRCSRPFLWKQHCSTLKHKRQRSTTPTKTTHKSQEGRHYCDHCGKGYKQRSGLWRHGKTCGPPKKVITNITKKNKSGYLLINESVGAENTVIDDSVKAKPSNTNVENDNADMRLLMERILAGIHSDSNVKNEMMIQLKAQREIIQDMIPRIGNNNNNRFNVNVFLNEQCKNAINLSDFIESLQIQLDDLIYTKDNGLVEGVSNVFVNALNQLDTFRRPIHCTDVKRETLYIKENDEWGRDENKYHIKTAINDIANKQRKTITIWEEENPEWENTDNGRDEYIKIVQEAMKDVSQSSNENKIIKNIVKETVISKDVITDK